MVSMRIALACLATLLSGCLLEIDTGRIPLTDSDRGPDVDAAAADFRSDAAATDLRLVDLAAGDAGPDAKNKSDGAGGREDRGLTPGPDARFDAGPGQDAGSGLDTGPGPDAAPDLDAGAGADTGLTPDAGAGADTGPTPDAGAGVDTGPSPDTGAGVDTGPTPDTGAGVDTGPDADAASAPDLALPKVLFEDDFEGTLSQWTASGAGAPWAVTGTWSAQGAQAAMAQATGANRDSLLSATFSAPGSGKVELKYSRRLMDLDSADDFEVSVRDQGAWTSVEHLGAATGQDADFVAKSFEIPNTASALRFACECNTAAERCLVDAVRVVWTP